MTPTAARAALALACALLAAGVSAAEETPPSIARARADAVSRLEVVATWADGQRLAAFRDDVFRRILELDPDHKRSRTGLRFARKSKKDPWVQVGYKPPGNWNVGLLPEGERRLATALAPYRDEVLAFAATAGAERDRWHEHLLDLLPQDEALRGAVGHVKHEGVWMLPESVGATERRSALRAKGRTLRADAAARLKPSAEGLEAGWDAAVEGRGWRVYASAPSQVREAAALAEAGTDLARHLLDAPPSADDPRRTLILLRDRREALSFLRRDHPELVADAEMVSGLGIDATTYLVYQADPVFRRTSGMRHAVGRVLPRSETRVRGWVSEGVGQRLCWYVAGEHGPLHVRLEATDRGNTSEEETPLPPEPEAWLPAAAHVLGRDGPPRLAATLSRSLNAMGTSDVLVAYALAAYLFEARPEQAVAFVRASVEKDHADAVVVETLGADVPALAYRLRRWLLDTKDGVGR